jgi:hypothetical protein
MRALAILTQRNEGAFLLEWLAHHRAVGFTDFLVFSNDCQDGSDLMLDRLAAMGLLVHLRNLPPYDKAGIQFSALKTAAAHPLLREADWILPLDIDEFVNIHVGDRTLAALLAALPQATAITLTWRLFGNAGMIAHEDRPVTARFTLAAPSVMYWPWRASMFKTLYRNDGSYAKPGIHRPRAPTAAVEQARWFDAAGRELPARFRRAGLFSPFGRANHALAQLNHYPLGAMQDYVLKADRGRAVHAGQRLGLDYWVERNFNTEEDHTILALAPRMQAERDRLMADPELAGLHRAAVAWRQARHAALMRDDEMRALMGRLMMTPPSRPLTQQEAAPLLAHAIAAQKEAFDARQGATAPE